MCENSKWGKIIGTTQKIVPKEVQIKFFLLPERHKEYHSLDVYT
jgi:hypothetical protein